MKSNEVRLMQFSSKDTDFQTIVNSFAELAGAAAYKNFGNHGIIEEVKVDDYSEKNEKIKSVVLAYSAKHAGIDTPKDAEDLVFAMDNQSFKSVFNSIVARTLYVMMTKYRAPQLDRLSDVVNVKVGDSLTYEIDTKSLPIAQKATYGSNVTMVPSYAKGSVTISPKPYSIGVSLDVIRMMANGYDWGYAVARVYAGMILAQYKLVVSKIFNTALLNGTPLYQENFAASTYTQLADDVGMLNGGSIDDVLALGTRVAWQAIAALATQGGFSTKDEYIRNAYLQKIYGVDSMILDQFTGLSAPFTTANAAGLRAIPNNLIVLVPKSGDKVIKLVREAYIRVIETPANDNTLNRYEYSYFQSFDADLATASYFGLQGTTAA